MKSIIKDMLDLDVKYGEKMITWLYWVSLAITIVSGSFSMVREGLTFFAFIRGLFVIGFGVFLARFFAELVLAFFRTESHLRALRETNLKSSISANASERENG